MTVRSCGSSHRLCCAALALLLLLVDSSNMGSWLHGDLHLRREQQQRRTTQRWQHSKQCVPPPQQLLWERQHHCWWHSVGGASNFPWLLLTVEATQQQENDAAAARKTPAVAAAGTTPALSAGKTPAAVAEETPVAVAGKTPAAAAGGTPAADGGAATGDEVTAAGIESVGSKSWNAEVHAEEQPEGTSILGQQREQENQRVSRLQEQKEEGHATAQETKQKDVPTSSVFPVELPPALRSDSPARISSSLSVAGPADPAATVLPLRFSQDVPDKASSAAILNTGDASGHQTLLQQQAVSDEPTTAASAGASSSPRGRNTQAPAQLSVDSAAARAGGAGQDAGQRDGVSSHRGGLLWTLLWPAIAVPGWIFARVSWLLQVLAVVAAAVVQLAPLPTALRMRTHRSTGEVQGLPFLLLLFSASLWLAYGLLKLDLVLLLPNITGLLLSCWYLRIFMKYCGRPSKDDGLTYSGASGIDAVGHMQQVARGRKQRIQIYCHGAGCLLVACGICVAAAAGLARPIHLVGSTAAVVNVLTYAAPLAALRRVLRTRSTACMPFEVSVGNWICSSLWLFYGWLSADPFIFLPNFLGTIVGLVQVGLLVKYPSPQERYTSWFGRNADEGCSSGLNSASAPGAPCSPCAESAYLLTAAGTDVTAADDFDPFSAADAGFCPCTTALRLPSATLPNSHGLGPLHADAYSSTGSDGVSPPCHYSTALHTAEGAFKHQQAWQALQGCDIVRLTEDGGSTTSYGNSTCSSLSSSHSNYGKRLCSLVGNHGSNYGSSSNYSSRLSHRVGHGASLATVQVATAAEGGGAEAPARHATGAALPDGHSRKYQSCGSNSGVSSISGVNPLSLLTHETLLRDWQQQFRKEDSSNSLSSGAAPIVAIATEGAGLSSA